LFFDASPFLSGDLDLMLPAAPAAIVAAPILKDRQVQIVSRHDDLRSQE
jgi:hypothetical protein